MMPNPRIELRSEREAIAFRICEARIRKGMTQRQLLQAMNVRGKNLISEWETCKVTPTLIYAAKAAKALGVSLDELTRGVI